MMRRSVHVVTTALWCTLRVPQVEPILKASGERGGTTMDAGNCAQSQQQQRATQCEQSRGTGGAGAVTVAMSCAVSPQCCLLSCVVVFLPLILCCCCCLVGPLIFSLARC